ncbi:MAG: type IV secretion system DNA-binding domain-containing protein [candidate division KSB1 bacterium]|nr:type IV secretion system DNA-binding domain-containing protein [candidate division KSB1 bacterium]
MRGDDVVAEHLQDQVDFINALFCPQPQRSFAVRYITEPHPRFFSAGRIEVVLLGKLEANTETTAEAQACALCQEVVALLGGTRPEYAWEIVTDRETFKKIWEPFSWEQAYVAEIRRREDRVQLESVRPRPVLGRGHAQNQEWNADEAVYFVHPFAPHPTTLSRLLRTMLLQRASLLLQASISPVWLTGEEEEGLVAQISKSEQYAKGWKNLARQAVIGLPTIHETRAAALCEGLLCQLLRLQDAPFLLNVTLASPEPVPRTVVEAVGVEITLPVGSQRASSALSGVQAGGYDVVFPQTEEENRKARQNAQFIAFELWGQTLAPEPLKRARWLVDAWEAAGAFRFPIATAEGLTGMEVQTARFRPLPREVAALREGEEPDRILVGDNRYLGMSEQVFLSERDRRHHVYVVGQTGTGKTTLLKTIIVGDVKAGRGLAVIDPHGDLFDELLRYIPENRLDDVVILDPSDTEFPVGLNMLECSNEEQRYFVVREMRAIMERLLEDQYGVNASPFAGPVFYQHLQKSLLWVMSRPNDPGTLLEFYEIYQRKGFWRKWLPLKNPDPLLKRWQKFLENFDPTARYGEGLSWGEWISSKFEDFLLDPKLRLIFGQKRSTIDLRRIMDEGKILLVNLAKGELSEANSRFLGMVLMAKILAAAMSRKELPGMNRRIFYLYVDEFQSLATQSFILLLSEARKFGLGLVLANQFVSQIKDERIVQAIFGNVGTLISFRVGQADACLLEPHFAPFFDNLDLTHLPNWHACVKTTANGQVVTPFTLRTVLPDGSPDAQIARKVREKSRAGYGRRRKEVEEEIQWSLEWEVHEHSEDG